jgi:hypothetical protein
MLIIKIKIIFLYCIITLIAFACAELFVRTVVDFPVLSFGKSYHIYPNDKNPKAPVYENEIVPHSEYYSMEDGYHVYRKNNLGLQGTDVVLNDKSKYIYVTGNSYIEARASAPQDISTSVFMDLLHKNVSRDYQVINIGIGGTIPYEGWCRLVHWSKKIKPDYVILVITDSSVINMLLSTRHPYVLPENFNTEVHNWKFEIVKVICNNSSFANLLRVSIRKSGITVPITKSEKVFFRPYADLEVTEDSYQLLLTSLLAFKKNYGDKFICLSLMNSMWNKRLVTDCRNLNIHFDYDSNLKNMNQFVISGGAHFNKQGNQLLGKDLYKAFILIKE